MDAAVKSAAKEADVNRKLRNMLEMVPHHPSLTPPAAMMLSERAEVVE